MHLKSNPVKPNRPFAGPAISLENDLGQIDKIVIF